MTSLHWNKELAKVAPINLPLFQAIPNLIISGLEKFGITLDIDKFSIESGPVIGQYYPRKRTKDKLSRNDKVFIRYNNGYSSFDVSVLKKGKLVILLSSNPVLDSISSYLGLERIINKSFCNSISIFIYLEERYAIRHVDIMTSFHYRSQTDPYNRKESLGFSHELNFFFDNQINLQYVNKRDNLKFLDNNQYGRNERAYIMNDSYDLSLSEILWITENEAIAIKNDEARKLIPEALYQGVYLFENSDYYSRFCMADMLSS